MKSKKDTIGFEGLDLGEKDVVRRKMPEKSNDLDGKTWTKYSISVWSDVDKDPRNLKSGHPATFPLEIAERLIRIFTKGSGAVVLDPFAGTGTTVLAAKRLGKTGIGIELYDKFAEYARNRCANDVLFQSAEGTARIVVDDANNVASICDPDSVDLIVTSPPYWDVLTQRRTADYKDTHTYGGSDADLGLISDYREFIGTLGSVFAKLLGVMKPGGYCCVIVMDLRKKDRFYAFHSDLYDELQRQGFLLEDLVIWDRRREYNNMRPLGYPSKFIVNKAHEYVLIMRKPLEKRK
jgi:DNA modification methylase